MTYFQSHKYYDYVAKLLYLIYYITIISIISNIKLIYHEREFKRLNVCGVSHIGGSTVSKIEKCHNFDTIITE